MKTTFKVVLLIIVAIVAFSCHKPSGPIVRITEFQGQEIDKIEVGSTFEVRIIKTDTQNDNRIELHIGERLIPYLRTSLVNGNLKIELTRIPNKLRIDNNLFVDIYTTTFSEVDGFGSSEFTIVDAFEYKSTLSLLLSESSEIRYTRPINIDGDVFIDIFGASELVLGDLNTNSNLSVYLDGASEIKMSAVTANFVDANLSGASDFEIYELNVATGFDYDLVGSSDMNIYSGECKTSNCHLECRRSSSYRGAGFVVDSMTVILSGVSYAFVDVLGVIRIRKDIVSHLGYMRYPSTTLVPF